MGVSLENTGHSVLINEYINGNKDLRNSAIQGAIQGGHRRWGEVLLKQALEGKEIVADDHVLALRSALLGETSQSLHPQLWLRYLYLYLADAPLIEVKVFLTACIGNAPEIPEQIHPLMQLRPYLAGINCDLKSALVITELNQEGLLKNIGALNFAMAFYLYHPDRLPGGYNPSQDTLEMILTYVVGVRLLPGEWKKIALFTAIMQVKTMLEYYNNPTDQQLISNLIDIKTSDDFKNFLQENKKPQAVVSAPIEKCDWLINRWHNRLFNPPQIVKLATEEQSAKQYHL